MKKKIVMITIAAMVMTNVVSGCKKAEDTVTSQNQETAQETDTLLTSAEDKDKKEKEKQTAEHVETDEKEENTSHTTNTEPKEQPTDQKNDSDTKVTVTEPEPTTNTNTGTGNGNASQETGTSGSASEQNTVAPTTAPSTTPEPAPAPNTTPTHSHTWVAVTQTIQHEATGHYETRVVTEAWDEAVYEYRTICNKCGKDITDDVDFHYAFECDGSYSNKKIQIGTIHHDAVTEQVWIEDSAAWTETVITGYVCECGATQ